MEEGGEGERKAYLVESIAINTETPPFFRYMLHSSRPRRQIVTIRRDIDLDSFQIQCKPGSRHVILPAHETSDLSNFSIRHNEPVSRTTTPDESFSCCWY